MRDTCQKGFGGFVPSRSDLQGGEVLHPSRLISGVLPGVLFPTTPFVEIPLPPHPGAFGVARRYDVHTGVDLYVPEGTEVFALESGLVVAVEDFTGPKAGFPWWNDTQAVLVEGVSGVLLYGELDASVKTGDFVQEGQLLGYVKRVLRKDKGTPTSMLHFERYTHGTTASVVWELGNPKPYNLVDPTLLLRKALEM